jgi:SAM-dependent methyltransferase
MDWRIKAALQNVFSRLPFGESLNYAFQRYVTRGVPIDKKRLEEIVARAGRHLEAIARYWKGSLAGATFYEFGAGWDLASPLSFYCHGVERQILVDIADHLRLPVLNHTIGLFAGVDAKLARRPGTHISSKTELRSTYGIDFRAPFSAGDTGLPGESLDVITSSNTLEHVPPDHIDAILRECRRLLRPDGVMSFLVDYVDHYSYFDARIGAQNFLQYSERAWRRFNPPLHYQNRLRHSDYRARFRAAGFEIVEERAAAVEDCDRAWLGGHTLDQSFFGYAPDDLLVRDARFVLRKN